MGKELWKGNEAIAEAAVRAGLQSYFGYPITPQTHIVEALGEMVKAGEIANCEYINVESEFAALSVATASTALLPSESGTVQLALNGAALSVEIRFHDPVEQPELALEHS